MTDSRDTPGSNSNSQSSFDDLLQSSSDSSSEFSIGFRGYDKQEVDSAIGDLTTRLNRATTEITGAEQRQREAVERAKAQQREEFEQQQKEADQLRADMAAVNAQLEEAQRQVTTLTSELADDATDGEGTHRNQFEAVLRVAEEQASLLIQNAVTQAERLLDSARDEADEHRSQGRSDGAAITAEAQHAADQVHLKIDTERTAHEAAIEREAAHAAEKVAQAEREAETIRSEAEKGAAALRAMVTRETTELRADAERAVREMNARVLEFEESLTRRQDDAQQEFLVLHNQAVAHAERITSDANAQVTASLEHAQRISNKADDYERVMRAQAKQIEAEARLKAEETMDRARTKAQGIVDSVTDHTNGVLRDAEDRTRQLRWQQQQLTSFMSEVRELIRPESRGKEPAKVETSEDTIEEHTEEQSAEG
ncbi:cell division septum initiation protein DivIVA [Microbacterium halimionae]|uniref:Cell division septum initiation protein DivIVA n=1 Tax=Microbacterium halimionae TaxID=1526413 RepID=A0A7W3JRE3_9MICO|nr:cell division initiation protein [Microbacterium halimionae]MBA8817553.1 cell division septum initiation protein DivIVA [Microbacterium halimionae]NII94263.1 cell division septum initiation protein DivIVA [Microbacterium halimionae]